MGGGFGMFSSSDRLQYRIVRCFLTSERGDRPVKVPRSLRRFSSLAKSMPTRDNLLNLAQRLNNKRYYKKASYADGIRVEVLIIRFDPETNHVYADRVREVRVKRKSQ